ncbi:TetR family transcriptional regulator [bacterium]|nr:TetR family transcriptional regulator [bacterium]
MPIQKVDKERIIKDSLKTFKAQGYHKTTMADIAKACGILKGSLYHYFKSKEELMEAVIDYLTQYYENKIFSVKNKHDINGYEKLVFLMKKSEEIFLTDNGGCLMASIGLETVNVIPHFTQKIQRFFKSWISCFEQIFSDKFPPEKATELAEYGVAEIEGSVLLMLIFQDEKYLKHAHQRILNRYINS